MRQESKTPRVLQNQHSPRTLTLLSANDSQTHWRRLSSWETVWYWSRLLMVRRFFFQRRLLVFTAASVCQRLHRAASVSIVHTGLVPPALVWGHSRKSMRNWW